MTTRSRDGVWRSNSAMTLADLEISHGTGRREPIDFTVAEMKRLNGWLKKHGLNVNNRKWRE